MRCPPIPFTAAEVRRDAYLWQLAAAFQAVMDEARNPCALKGGTALRFQAGLNRPSTDLDFEGDRPVSVRKALVKAVAAATPAEPYRIGRDLLWRGTVTMTLRDAEAAHIRIGVDYRQTGSRSGMPKKVPLDRCERVRGITIYRPNELVSRKLHTIVGERPREKARDIYDAAWIVAEQPALVGKADAAKLQQWLNKMTPKKRRELENRLRGEELTSRVSTSDVWQALETGIQSLEQRPDNRGPDKDRRPEPPPPRPRDAVRVLKESQRQAKTSRTQKGSKRGPTEHSTTAPTRR